MYNNTTLFFNIVLVNFLNVFFFANYGRRNQTFPIVAVCE